MSMSIKIIASIGRMSVSCCYMLLTILCSAHVLMAEQEYGDACYRKLLMLGGFYDCSHAAIYIGMDSSGQHWILEQSGSTPGIQIAWFSDMTDYNYYGSFTSSLINPSFSTRRSIVQENGLDLLARSANIGYTWQDCLTPANGHTAPIDTGEIQSLRCDGLVEFCFEAAGVDSWGKNGGNYSITNHHAEHNNFYEHGFFPSPDSELCPCVQHGRMNGGSARLTRASVIDVPSCSLTYLQHDGYTDVTITATDRSGIHRIMYSREGIDSNWQGTPASGLHRTTDTLSHSFSIYSTSLIHYYAIDKGGNKPQEAPGALVPVGNKPVAPTGVAASDDSYANKIRVTWNAVPNALTYEVWRHTSNNASSAQRIATSDSSPYDDTSAAAGVTYFYWLKAQNTLGTSAFSTSDSGRSLPPPCQVSVPDTPTIGPHVLVVGHRCFLFTTGGSNCSNEHAIEYRFNWDDLSTSPWGDASQSHCYETDGNYWVRAQARCENGSMSTWSPEFHVYIAPTTQPTPIITAINPTHGPAAGGNTVIISGTNFSENSATVTAVKFGTVSAVFTVNSTTQITATAPAGTAGDTVHVAVTTSAGTSSNTAADDYTYDGAATRSIGGGLAAASPGSSATLDIPMIAQGDEVILSFTLEWNPDQFAFDSCTIGATLANVTFTSYEAQASSGKLGIAIVGPGFTTPLPSGTYTLVQLKGTLAAGLANGAQIPISITSSLTDRTVSNIDPQSLPCNWLTSTWNIVTGHEADVSPRPSGNNGALDATDIMQVIRFVLGMDQAASGSSNEFQRADCSPRTTSGDGRLDATDIMQAIRFVLGMDSKQGAGGPAAPTPAGAPMMSRQASAVITDATLSLENNTVVPGQAFHVPVTINSSVDVAVSSFSIAFDNSKLEFISWAPGTGMANNCTLTTNPEADQSAPFAPVLPNGKIGFVIVGPNFTDPIANTGSAQELLLLTFRAKESFATGTTTLQWSDDPAARSLTDGESRSITTTWNNSTITINPAPSMGTLAMAAEGNGVTTPALGTHDVELNTPQKIMAQADANWLFTYWPATGGAIMADPTAGATTIKLTASGKVSAHFLEKKKFPVTMVNGMGGGYYYPGEQVKIAAQATGSGKEFAEWNSADNVAFADASALSTSFLMPARPIAVTAAWRDTLIPDFACELHVAWNSGIGYTLQMSADAKSSDQYVADEDCLIDVLLPSLPAPPAEEAYFHLPDNNVKLAWDSHYLDETVNMLTWNLQLTIPPGTDAQLAWNELSLPAGWLLFINKNGSLSSLPMQTESSLLLETPGTHDLIITAIRASEYATFTYQLQKGWNMIGIPLQLTRSSEEYLLTQKIMSIKHRSIDYEQPNTLVAGKAYWLFCENDIELTVDGTCIRNANSHFSPEGDCIGPVTNRTMSIAEGAAWEWTPQGYRHPEIINKKYQLKAGKGYWIFMHVNHHVPQQQTEIPLSKTGGKNDSQ